MMVISVKTQFKGIMGTDCQENVYVKVIANAVTNIKLKYEPKKRPEHPNM